MQTVSNVDISKFMGNWYVIANIPTFFERNAYNPIERYALNDDGTIDTTFVFNEKTADGALREMNARGFVRPGSGNAIWGMQFVWPIKADYRVVYLDPQYQYTIIGRNKRDYLWIMSRHAGIPDEKLDEMIRMAVELGYDASAIRITSWQISSRQSANDEEPGQSREREAG